MCIMCKKAVIHSHTLKTHEMTHIGVKPYICNRCSCGIPVINVTGDTCGNLFT